MKIFGKTDIGRIRAGNQDAFVSGSLLSNESADDEKSKALFAIVCDGMGGASGGHVASAIAVKVLSERIVKKYASDMNANNIRNLLESAIDAANIEIFDASTEDENLRGMGTTAIAAIAVDRYFYMVHVGDSRAYVCSKEEIKQITRDHSIVQDMVEQGKLSPDEARNHPRKHLITRALGVDSTVENDYLEIELKQDQILLICTDGLTNMIETARIHEIVNNTEPSDIPAMLIHEANMAGGSDNITVVVIK